MSSSAKIFGAELRRLRADRGLSQEELGLRAGYSTSAISKAENNVQPPTPGFLTAVEKVLDTGGRLHGIAAEQNGQAHGAGQPPRPNLLPVARPNLIGRSVPVREVTELLTRGQTRVVAIDGAPGVGKTAFAVYCAAALPSTPPHDPYPDGRLYVDLRGHGSTQAPEDPTDALGELLLALRVPSGIIPPTLSGRVNLYRSVLAERRALIVLDNARSVAQVRPLLPGAVSPTTVLITSRQQLSSLRVEAGAKQVTLAALAREDAVELLRDGIGDERRSTDSGALDRLAQCCGDLPLALVLAAEHVAVHPHHSLAELAAEFDNGPLDRLVSLDDPDIAVRAAVSWSYQALPDSLGQLFCLLGLYPDQVISTATAAALADVSLQRVRLLLEQLVHAHLLEQLDRDRYRLHDLLRAYAAERAKIDSTVDERHAALHRLIQFYTATMRAASALLCSDVRSPDWDLPIPEDTPALAFNDRDAALAWCDNEVTHIPLVVRCAHNAGMHHLAWRLAANAFTHMCLRHHWRTWRATMHLAWEAATASRERIGQAVLATQHAEVCRHLGEHEDAQTWSNEALRVYDKLGDTPTRA